jgi:hypothetical protein
LHAIDELVRMNRERGLKTSRSAIMTHAITLGLPFLQRLEAIARAA